MSPKIGNKAKILLLPLLLGIVTEDLSNSVLPEKNIEDILEKKLSLFAGDVMIHIDTFKESTPKLLELKTELSKSRDTKMNLQKEVAKMAG